MDAAQNAAIVSFEVLRPNSIMAQRPKVSDVFTVEGFFSISGSAGIGMPSCWHRPDLPGLNRLSAFPAARTLLTMPMCWAVPEGEVQTAIDKLAQDHGLTFFVVYVDSFDGETGETWGQQVADLKQLGARDALMVVAVQDRKYALLADTDIIPADEEPKHPNQRHQTPAGQGQLGTGGH